MTQLGGSSSFEASDKAVHGGFYGVKSGPSDCRNPEFDEWLRTRAAHRYDRLQVGLYLCLYEVMEVKGKPNA